MVWLDTPSSDAKGIATSGITSSPVIDRGFKIQTGRKYMIQKHFILPLLAAVISLSFAAGTALSQQQPIANYYKKGVELYNAGDYQNAKKYLEFVISKQPNSPHARSYLAKTNLAIKQGRKPKNSIENALSNLKLPVIDFSDASLGDVLDYLAKRSEELSGGKIAANFVYKGTPEQKQNLKVTLKLRDVPMTEVIRYVGGLTETQFTYEEHAVVGTPFGGAASSEPASTPAAANQEPAKTVNPLPGTPAPSPFQ
ncbi:MAG: hypothetical protein HKN23_17770 [Verrucomicrobiales bacterium]|nr:hypothetical protein [Verrucomicrobiales bacterium]